MASGNMPTAVTGSRRTRYIIFQPEDGAVTKTLWGHWKGIGCFGYYVGKNRGEGVIIFFMSNNAKGEAARI